MYTILAVISEVAIATCQNVTVTIVKNTKPRLATIMDVTIIRNDPLVTIKNISYINLSIFVVIDPITSYTNWTSL